MTAIPMIDMAEVTRLTREGRLMEATALIQAGMPQQARMPEPFVAGVEEPKPFADMTRLLQDLPRVTRGDAARPFEAPAWMPPETSAPRFEERRFANAAGARVYKVFVPGGHEGEALPLVVMLHGCGQSPDDFAAGTRMNLLAEEYGFIAAYPAQSQSANPQRCWNWFNAAEQERDRGEPSIVAGITREIVAEFGADPARVYVAGLSAGGAAAATMAAVYPDLYAAVCVHSGLAHGAARDMMSAFGAMQGGAQAHGAGRGRAPVPTIVFHGDRDTTVNATNADHVIAQAGAAQAPGADALETRVTKGTAPRGAAFTRITQCDTGGKPVIEQWVLHGAGHAWSGGSPTGSFTDPRGVDASREMLRFFWSHAREGRGGST
jgi:poly(hydroxyalkanoate) depolymerase family esterase